MKPPARIAPIRRRLLAALLLVPSAVFPADVADQCVMPVTTDPRLDALRKADPNDPHMEVTSDQGDLSRKGDAHLSGNVTVRSGQRLLSADQAQIDGTNRTISAQGKVEYLDPMIHVTGRDGQFSDTEGNVDGAHFELVDGSGRGSARGAQVHNKTILVLQVAKYTSCPPGNEDWLLKAQDISIDQATKTATAHDVKLDFKGIPILYTPWISFPTGDQRKSGLLFPVFGNGGRSGTQFGIPWYWDIAPNYDATLTSRYFTSRGFRFDPEFRYLTQESRGTFEAQYLPHDTQRGEARGLFQLEDVTNFAPETRGIINASYVTDNSYFEDFGNGFEGTSIVFLDQLAEVRRETEHWSLLARTENYQVIDNSLADDERPYAMLPQISLDGHWNDLGHGLGASFDAEAVNFYRTTGPQGFRLDAAPALSWGIGGRGAYVDATAAWRYTAYALHDTTPGAQTSPTRSLPVLSLDSGFALERAFGSSGQRLQTLEPRVQYVYIPYRDQDAIPVFDTATPDLNMVELFRTNRYVGADRVGDANLVSAGVTTRLLDATSGQQYLSATVGQAFYFQPPRVTLPGETPTNRSTSDLIAELDLEALKNWSARGAYEWNPDANQTERAEFGVQYRPAGDSVVNATYRYQRDLLEQVDLSAAWPIVKQWNAYARWVYSISENKTLDQFVGFQYSSCCWKLSLIARHFISSRTGASSNSIMFQLELKGLSSVGIDEQAFLRDAIHGYSPVPPVPKS